MTKEYIIKSLPERLIFAVKNCHVDDVKPYIKKGNDVNGTDALGWPLLLLAAQCGHLEMCALLLELGCDIDGKDQSGRTAILIAAIEGHSSIVRMLLEFGANINERDINQRTPLITAVWMGSECRAAKILIGTGADVNIRDTGYYSRTLLHIAAARNDVKMVKQLVEAGIDLEMVDTQGKKADSSIQSDEVRKIINNERMRLLSLSSKSELLKGLSDIDRGKPNTKNRKI